MPDTEILVRRLERIRGRRRGNELAQNAASALTISLSIPVVFKLLDLATPFRGRTVAAFFILWAVGTAGIVALLAWLARRRTGLEQAAADLDRAARLDDEVKTALWFIQQPHRSRWIEAQIARAAETMRRINIEKLFPRLMPRKSVAVVALALLLGVLNFLPLPLNHNWFLLDAAPAFDLPPAIQALIDQAKKLLEDAALPDKPNLAERLNETLKNLREGRISMDAALKELDALREELRSGALDAGAFGKSLAEMAAQLGNSKLSESVDQALGERDLARAIQELREAVATQRNARSQEEAARQLEDLQQENRSGALTPQALRERADNIARQLGARGLPPTAANAMTAGNLQQAAETLRQSATSESQGFANLSPQQLAQMAQQLAAMAQGLENQQNNAAASQGLQNLASALAQSQNAPGSGQSGQPGSSPGQSANGANGQPGQGQNGQGSSPGNGQGQGGPGQSPGQGQGQGIGQGPGQQGQPGPGPSGPGEGLPSGEPGGIGNGGTSPGGLGGLFQGRPTTVPPGPPTSLAVRLEKEALVAEHAQTPSTSLLSASQQEQSKLTYRDVPSTLNPAQKDVLDRQRVPWESKTHIRNYFDSIHETR